MCCFNVYKKKRKSQDREQKQNTADGLLELKKYRVTREP